MSDDNLPFEIRELVAESISGRDATERMVRELRERSRALHQQAVDAVVLIDTNKAFDMESTWRGTETNAVMVVCQRCGKVIFLYHGGRIGRREMRDALRRRFGWKGTPQGGREGWLWTCNKCVKGGVR